MAQYAVWLSGRMEFEEARQVLHRLGQISISTSSVWRRTQRWGEQFKALETAQRAIATASPVRGVPVAGETRCQPEMGVAMDGVKVYIRKEDWKELKVGCVFDVQVRPTLDKQTWEMLDLAHCNHRVMASASEIAR